jgi:hypothetical protein
MRLDRSNTHIALLSFVTDLFYHYQYPDLPFCEYDMILLKQGIDFLGTKELNEDEVNEWIQKLYDFNFHVPDTEELERAFQEKRNETTNRKDL